MADLLASQLGRNVERPRPLVSGRHAETLARSFDDFCKFKSGSVPLGWSVFPTTPTIKRGSEGTKKTKDAAPRRTRTGPVILSDLVGP